MSLKHSDEFKRDAVCIALKSGLTRRKVASDHAWEMDRVCSGWN